MGQALQWRVAAGVLAALCGVVGGDSTAPLSVAEVPNDLVPTYRTQYDRQFDEELMCRLWVGGGEHTPGEWEPEGLTAVAFDSVQKLQEYLDGNPKHTCKYVHIATFKQKHSEHGAWLTDAILALRGRVVEDVILDNVDDGGICRSLERAKAEYLIERDRCRAGTNTEYKWCRCRGHKSKTLTCVPPEHPLRLDPSPLRLDDEGGMRCLFRITYAASHSVDLPTPTLTPHRPYPTNPTTVRGAVLAYINSAKILKGTADTFRTWLPHFLIPQNVPSGPQKQEMHLFLIRETGKFFQTEADLISTFRLSKVKEEAEGLGPYYTTTAVPGAEVVKIFLSTSEEKLPSGLDHEVLRSVRPRCGCGPVCSFPTHKSPDAHMISSLGYVQGTSAFTEELFRDARLQQYDFVIKLDWDIWFFRTLKTPVLRSVIDSGAWGFHTGFANNGNGCSRDAQRAFDGYARKKRQRPSAAGEWLFENEQTAWHSALFGMWTGLVLSPEYAELMSFLRNSEYGYSWFRYRWTDQSVWPKLVGYFRHDLTKAMLDFRELRWHPSLPRPTSIFYHRKRQRGDREVCCGRCDDGEPRACYKKVGPKTSKYVFCYVPPKEAKHYNITLCER